MSETANDRPSIAELQNHLECHQAGCWIDAQKPIMEAAPVLLEIAATGLAWAAAEDAMEHAERGAPRALAAMHATKAFDVHRAALAKVRP